MCNDLMHMSSYLKFLKAEMHPRKKNCGPRRCSILSLRVYETGKTLRYIFSAKKRLHTPKVCNLFFEGF